MYEVRAWQQIRSGDYFRSTKTLNCKDINIFRAQVTSVCLLAIYEYDNTFISTNMASLAYPDEKQDPA